MSLEPLPSDIFRTICQHLNLPNIDRLTQVNSSLRKTIMNDDIFWKHEFTRQFPHLFDKATRQGEPKSWYVVFKKSYLDEYGFNDPDVNVRKNAYRKAALFTAAKIGDAAEFKKLHPKEFKLWGERPDGLPSCVTLCDKSGYSCYYWLYKNGHQAISDDIFSDVVPLLQLEGKQQQILTLVILLNQHAYLKQHAEDFLGSDPNFPVAAQLGSLELVTLLFEKFPESTDWSYLAFICAASRGNTNIAKFFHEKSVEFTNAEKNNPKDELKKYYEHAIHKALQEAISNGHKETVNCLLEIYQKNWFTLNYKKDSTVQNFYGDLNPCFLLSYAALQADPDYVTMLLNAGIGHAENHSDTSPIRHAVFAGNYETFIALLKNDVHKYTKNQNFQRILSDGISATNKLRHNDYTKLKNWLAKTPLTGELHMRALVELIGYQYELEDEMQKNTLSKLASSFSNVFSSSSKIEKTVEHKVCDMLFDVLTRKHSTKILDELNSAEKGALEKKGSRLADIYQNLLGEIQKIQQEEVSAQARQLMNLDGVS
jgi:ankyrin repeat protein